MQTTVTTIARGLIALIAVEVATSLWLIPLTPAALAGAVGTAAVFAVLYRAMLRSGTYLPDAHPAPRDDR